ncbi:MAG: PKD domain-containing protein, partial [Actinobacteria bacterium]|nr:PKD domain-containing protein [Actinomycetota bacterium]
MITDPLGDAWYSDNQQGGEGEDGDLCNTTYSPTPGRNYNQVIAGHRYFTQGEWSNLDNGCAFGLSAYMPVARIKASHVHVRPHRKLSFDASRSRSPSGSIVSYRWQFGDGKSASGRTVSHTFKHTGKHTVTLTVTDSNHLTGTAKITIIVRKRK